MFLAPKKIDWYIFRKFMGTFLVALVLIIGIVIIFDVSEKIDDFVEKKAPLNAIIFDYYLNFIPYFINMYSPMFVFITVIFFTSKMASNTEIVAILSGGISFHRMMLPYMVAATLITVASLGLNLFVIPDSNKERVEFEQKYMKEKPKKANRNIHYQVSPGQFVYAESFSSWNNTAYKFTIEKIEDSKLVSKISAETAVYDTLKGCWTLKKCHVRNFNDDLTDDVLPNVRQIDTIIPLTVKDFYFSENTVTTLDYNELNEMIQRSTMRGDGNVKIALIEKHTRFALPFSAFILTIMGVSLSSRKRRGGIGWNIALGIALAFTYILFMRFSQMFVHTDTLSPAVALWLPNIVFAVIAVILYRLAPK
jgi:lipopolysaccharide export system permease protein